MCGRKHCVDELSIRGPSVARYWSGRTCALEKNRLHSGEIKNQVRGNGEAGPKYDSLRVRFHARHAAERPELRHAGPNDVNREAELETPSRVACRDLLGIRQLLLQLFYKTSAP